MTAARHRSGGPSAQTRRNRVTGGRKAAEVTIRHRRRLAEAEQESALYGPEGSMRGSSQVAMPTIAEILARLPAGPAIDRGS